MKVWTREGRMERIKAFALATAILLTVAAGTACAAVDEATVRQMAAAFLAHRGSDKEVARVVALEGAAL